MINISKCQCCIFYAYKKEEGWFCSRKSCLCYYPEGDSEIRMATALVERWINANKEAK